MNNTQNTTDENTTKSPHASISFTAHYTGEMWQKLGLSHPALATKKGKKLHQILYPVEWFANTFFGVTTNKTLSRRHHLIDKQVEAFLQQHPNGQIIEIAAGLSPRGWRFLQKHPNLPYGEIDLPAMSALKKQRAQSLPKPIPQFFAADLLADDLTNVFNQFDKQAPLLIIAEGLINYFSLDMLGKLSERLATQLKQFSKGYWITENYPFSDKASYNALAKLAGTSLRAITKSSFSFYFNQPAEAQRFFCHHGFKQVDIFQPSQPNTAQNTKHLGDTVWVMVLNV